MPSGRASLRRVRHAVDPRGDTPAGLVLVAVRRYLSDGMADRAPAMAYYGLLSLFPSLILAFSVVRFVAGPTAPEDVAGYARAHGVSGAVSDVLSSAVHTALSAPVPSAGIIGLIGLMTLMYGTSRAFTATGRALDAVGRRTSLPRSARRRAEDIWWSLVLLVTTLVALLLTTLSGRVLEELLNLIGLSGISVVLVEIVRWPLTAALLILVVAAVRWAAPTGPRHRPRIVTTGSLLTVVGLLVATVGFDVYVAYLAGYNTSYGAFAGAIILILWIWMGASLLLFGAEMDAALEERRLNRR